MSSFEEFETTLKEVVKAKRVSASKMTVLTDFALKSMENDTQLVSILYRTHKALPTPAKVSSLYAFDALARAARSKVTKHNLTTDTPAGKGNCATFLQKIEGVLDGLFQDMIISGTPESKEKSKKILDIWTKANTFPSTVLTRLRDLVKEAEKESDKLMTNAITDPRTTSHAAQTTIPATPTPPLPLPTPTPTPTSVDPVQSTLLALLSQVGGSTNSQITPNTAGFPGIQTQLDPAQYALLQQLAQSAKLGNSGPPPSLQPQHQAFPPSIRPDSAGGFGGAPQPHPPYRDNANRGDPRFNRFDNTGHGRGRGENFDARSDFRGSYRGGGFRDRGRGFEDGRDKFSRGGDHHRSPPGRGRNDRSRSPPSRYTAGAAGRRDIKPYSPPHRPVMAQSNTSTSLNGVAAQGPASINATSGPLKDEFGRDIRSDLPDVMDTAEGNPESGTDSVAPHKVPVSADQVPSVQTAPAANTSSQIHNAATPAVAATPAKRAGLDKFDMSTFDFTAPSSWEELGKMWQVTYGYLPSQEELMQFVMTGGAIAGAAAGGMLPGMMMMDMDQSWQQGGQVWGGQGQVVGSRMGGYPTPNQNLNQDGSFGKGQGNFRNVQQQQGGGYMGGGGSMHNSDAIVLGGGDDTCSSNAFNAAAMMQSPQQAGMGSPPSGDGGPGGRMQRVGEKWVFVRDENKS